MLITIIKNDKIENFTLPPIVHGNYWIKDVNSFGKERNLINVEANNGKWLLKSNIDTQIFVNGTYCEHVEANIGEFYTLSVYKDENPIMLYIRDVIDNTYKAYNIVEPGDFSIKNNSDSSIFYNISLSTPIDVLIYFKDGYYYIKNNSGALVFKNKKFVTNELLDIGDVIFIYGLSIIFMGSFMLINNPRNNVTLKNNKLRKKEEQTYPSLQIKEDPYATAFSPDDYFSRLPRFREIIEEEKIVIDAPPEKAQDKNMPLIYVIGPMLTMGMISFVSLGVAINNIVNKDQSISENLPTLIISVSMLFSMVLWPFLSNRFERKYKKRQEKLRQERFTKYLTEKEKQIEEISLEQKKIMEDNFVDSLHILKYFDNNKEHLWEKDIKDDDFLELRIGIGSMYPKINISYPEEHFSLYEDNLKDILYGIINKNRVIENVPKTINLTKDNIVTILGNKAYTYSFVKSLLLQIAYYHSYQELKIVYFTGEENKYSLDFLRVLPHIFNDEKNIRFYATDIDQIKDVSNYLTNILYSRMYPNDDERNVSGLDYKNYKDYYLIITDNIKLSKNSNLIKRLLDLEINYGFSVLIINESLNDVPNECETFLQISDNVNQLSKILKENQSKEDLNDFKADLCNYNLYSSFEKLANIPLEVENSSENLPNVYKFLEMYGVGNTKQLNILNRWKKSDPTISLSVPVGIDSSLELFNLDLHEKYHGPHGLVAGMTGSGKSEFLITYILSLAVNFHPHDVSFVIIDYKGGGLSGAFENKLTGFKLPHLAGSITNLDVNEMNRSLASIESELRRRQKIFNEAREKTGEATIDIYKYQRLYREGAVTEPVSHLFIISDEFAELKLQQPDFMDELITTARIGRSLGAHLILATQKPSGIVDDQIWSNSKFRICLKVQEKSDSMDMIKTPEAALLKNAGRFYLQVGYNEYFALGQSAWCGGAYYPSEQLKKEVDESVNFLDEVCNVIYSVKEETGEKKEAKGDELTSVLSQIGEVASSLEVKARKLWLDKIPEFIYVKDLEKKYNYQKQDYIIDPIIGEYDDPSNQSQHLLTLRLSELGNTIIYSTAGAGEELLLSTIVYSTIMYYGVEEVNFYIMDFGSETMSIFAPAPHVGDIIYSSDSEKILNLFKLLNQIIDDRKEKLKAYNGDIALYNLKSKEKLVNIVVIINNYEGFSELYSEYEEAMLTITRESIKYGIYFIITASGVNNVRYKLTQNFKQYISLQLNDSDDYSAIFGNTKKVVPSAIYGRGIIKTDMVYEFQTAWPYLKENLNLYLTGICENLSKKSKYKAMKIPVLPKHVLLGDILKEKYNELPVGINKDTLEVEMVDILNSGMYFITGNLIDDIFAFAKNLPKLIMHVYKIRPIIIDGSDLYESGEQVYKDNFKNVLTSIANYKDNLICIITGIKNILLDNKEIFNKINYKKTHIIIVDTIDNIKDLQYEEVIKNNASFSNALWLGEGIENQYTIKVNDAFSLRNVGSEYSYLVKNSKVKVIKAIKDGEDVE